MNNPTLRVLVAEPEQDIMPILKPIMSRASLELAGEVRIDEAISGLDKLNPDIIITGIEMGGLSLSRRAAQHKIDLPVIILTIHDSFTYVQQALYSGVSHYLLQPVSAEILDNALHSAAERTRGNHHRRDSANTVIFKDPYGNTALVTASPEPSQPHTNQILPLILKDLEENYSDINISLVYMAKKHYLDPSHLSRVFKKYTGRAFSEYLTALRIQKARDILELENYKAHQLAKLVGIPDPNYFIKCFKKVTGLHFRTYKGELYNKGTSE